MLFVTLEEPKPAIFELERAIELNQADALSIHNLGLALRLDQRYENALHCFERAITIQPN